MTEADDEIGTGGAKSKHFRQFARDRRHFDGLIDHRHPDVACRRLKREPLEAATDRDPAIRIGTRADENGDPRR